MIEKNYFLRQSEEGATDNFMEQVRINPGPEELQKCEWSKWRVSNSRPVRRT